MDGMDGEDFISDLLFGFEADDEVSSGLKALTKSGKARQIFGDIARTEILEEGENIDDSLDDSEQSENEQKEEKYKENTDPSSINRSKKVEMSSQVTLSMLREQDRKERRKLVSTLTDKLPKGVKLLLTDIMSLWRKEQFILQIK